MLFVRLSRDDLVYVGAYGLWLMAYGLWLSSDSTSENREQLKLRLISP